MKRMDVLVIGEGKAQIILEMDDRVVLVQETDIIGVIGLAAKRGRPLNLLPPPS